MSLGMGMELRQCLAQTLELVMECPLCETDVQGVDWKQVAENATAAEIDYSICPHCGQTAPYIESDDIVARLAELVELSEWKRRVRAWRKVLLKQMGFWVA
jgi:uncharacterized protein with PIN domain